MKKLSATALNVLLDVASAREMAARASLQEVISEEQSVTSELGRLSAAQASEPECDDLQVVALWNVWLEERRETLWNSLALIHARKTTRQAECAQASGKREALEALLTTSRAERRTQRDARFQEEVIQQALQRRHGRKL